MPLELEKPLETISLSERVYQLLRDQIIQGKLAPGEKLNIFALAEKLNVSRTPIKDAFNRLALEGLVTIHPQRGTFVTALEPEKVRHLFDVRLMMELWGAKRAVKDPKSLDIKRMEELLKRCDSLFSSPEESFDYMTFNQCDMEFHSRIVDAAQNPQLSRIYQSLNLHIQAMRVYWGRARHRALRSHKEHRRIFQALKQGGYLEVKRELTAHIVGSGNDIIKLLKERNDRLRSGTS